MRIVEPQAGSAAYAYNLAAWLDVQAAKLSEASLTYTDIKLCSAALRGGASARRRRGGRTLASVAIFGTVAVVGVEDRNHDGRVDLVDVWIGARAIVASVPAAICAAVDGRRP